MKERDRTTIRLPDDLKERLVKQADEMGISFNALVIILLNQGAGK